MAANPITEQHTTPNKWPGGNTKQAILIHWWGDPAAGPTFEGVINHFKNPASEVSAHFVAEDGRVAQLASLDDQCWHAKQANSFTIGIECNPRKSIGDTQTVAELIAWIWKQVGQIPIGVHKDYVPTACPGVWEEIVKSGALYAMADSRYKGEEMITNEDADKIADAILNRPLENAAGNQVALRGMLKAIDIYTGKQPERVWNYPLKNYLGNPITPQGLLYWGDKNQGQHYKLLVEANEHTKALAEAVAKGGEIDQEAIERAVKEAVDKAMENYELTLAPKDKREV